MDKKIVPAAASNSELARYIRGLIESRQESIDDLEDCLISLKSMDERNENSIDLRVGKAIPSDVGFGRVRIPLNNSLGVKPGMWCVHRGAQRQHGCDSLEEGSPR